MRMKGQGATEYLVLLAVVLIIALVAISLLGFFPGLALDAKKTQSDPYWKAARPFGIIEHSLNSEGNLTIVIQNNDANMLTLLNVSIANSSNGTATTFGGGEKKVMVIRFLGSCTAGSAYEYNVNFTYNSTDISNQKQIGTKPLIGKCS